MAVDGKIDLCSAIAWDKQIHFHTLRHLKAAMEYAKTREILHVMQLLGHKKTP